MNENQSEPHLHGGQESGEPAQGVKVVPAWKCAGIIVNPAPDYQTAFNQLDQISRLMYGVPCPDPPTGDLGTQLQALMSGNAAMNVIASLSTRPQFIELIWRVAMARPSITASICSVCSAFRRFRTSNREKSTSISRPTSYCSQHWRAQLTPDG
jgi:hypothetical protein